jgi:hypothetical protein
MPFEESFEDGKYSDRWSVFWQNFGDIAPSNDWEVTTQHPLESDHALYLHAYGDPNVLATNHRPIELDQEFTLEFTYYTDDENSRGGKGQIIDVVQNGSEGNYVSPNVQEPFASANRSPYGNDTQQFRLFNKEVTVRDEFTTGEAHTIRVVREGERFFGYHDDVELIRIPVDDVEIDLSRSYRFAFRSSGGYGEESHIYFDELTWRSGESSERPPSTPTPPSAPSTPRPTTPTQDETEEDTTATTTLTPDQVPYSLSEAGLYRDVVLGDSQYRVVWDIPSTGSERRAVLTASGELVGPQVTRDVLISDAWAGGQRKINWGNVAETAVSEKSQWQILEQLNRAADLSTEVVAAIALTNVSPTAGIPTALEALNSAIVWSSGELNDPYREQFSKMAEAGATIEWVDEKTQNTLSASELDSEVIDVVSLGVSAADAVSDLRAVGSTAQTVANVAQSKGSIQKGLMAGGQAARATAFQMWLGLAASEAISAATGLFEANARTSAAGVGHNAVRIPILRELHSLQGDAMSGRLSPPEIIRYHLYQMTQYQIAAAACVAMAQYQESVDESGWVVGDLLSFLFNSERVAELASENATRYENLAKYSLAVLGVGWKTGQNRFQESVNSEIHSQR